ncbi:MAG: sterol desaturase family protein [SAR86 cluster bacterium]|jgi:sterol desaturase/sphingolipid hydroxylase (fatty acid hydroxylase superfamily)|nr:MAG: sterol desaturase family protein [SAR86 cluster bacterium]URQ69538.1 sterol desaturase family protein [SAR86 cluster bacterium]|tara:strand:- start:242 stop:1075 length:834 start_codon:yes stop_codon:yes gene_type:complete
MTELTYQQVYLIGLPIVIVFILIEVLFSSLNNKKLYRKNDTLCTIGLLTGNILMVFLVKGITLAIHIYLYQYRILDLSSLIPIWMMWILAFVLIDLVFYFYHRVSHRSRFLWAVHMSHHSSEEMNFAVSFRQAWLGPISKIPFFIFLPIVGIDPTIIAIAGVISTLWGIVGHTQIIKNLGPFEYIFNTPSHHRVHHGSNKQYIDKNYGNLLIVWDRMFGTFEPEKESVKYGLVKNVKTFNPIKITFMEWSNILKDIKNSNNIKESLYLFFGPPKTKE